MVVGSNEYVVSVSFLTFNGYNIEKSYKQDIVTNIEFESILPPIKKYFFHHRMFDFVNKLELSGQKYQTNGNGRDEHYKGRFLFPMKYFV